MINEMTSKQRVSAVIEGKEFDRIPVYGWLKENLSEKISAEFGSVEAFEDRYEFDLAHIFGGPSCVVREEIDNAKSQVKEFLPSHMLEIGFNDVDDNEKWEETIKNIKHYSRDRKRFCYMQTPGIFEKVNSYFGIENHLMYMLLYPDEIKELYNRQAEWNIKFANHAIDLGVDMIHLSDDWGAQRSLLFDPKFWHDMIAPNHKKIIDAVHERDKYVSLHSDGNISQVLRGIAKLGFDVVHPYQVSAGMDYGRYFNEFSDSFAIMGGIDIQATLGFGNIENVKAEIEEVIAQFSNRGLILCTTHFVQNHCSIKELTCAYDTIYMKVRGQ